jgi:hypothetical protein
MTSLKGHRNSTQLVNPRQEPDQDLIEFLRHYKRLTGAKVCTQRIDASQVTVWTFKGGMWTRGTPDRAVRNGSWCQSYLTSALQLSRNEYDRVKRELFAQTRGLNGVYKHKSDDSFAIVYRPSPKMSNSTKAAIAGGLVLAGGLGLAGTRYALQAPTQNVAQTPQPSTRTLVKPLPTPSQPDTPNLPQIDLTEKLEDFYRRLKDICDIKATRIVLGYFPDLQSYEGAIQEYKDAGNDVARYQEQTEWFRRLARLEMPTSDVDELFDKSFAAIVRNREFMKSRDTFCQYFSHNKDQARLRKCRAALNYLQIKDQMDLELKDDESNDSQRREIAANLEQLLRQPTGPAFDALNELIRERKQNQIHRNVVLLNAVTSNLLQSYEPGDNHAIGALIKEYEPWLLNALKTPNAPEMSPEFNEKCIAFNNLWQRLKFYDILKTGLPEQRRSDAYFEARPIDLLFQRFLILNKLTRSESDAVDDLGKANEDFSLLREVDPNLSEFSKTFIEDVPDAVSKFKNNEELLTRYKNIKTLPSFEKVENELHRNYNVNIFNQLRRDLDNGSFRPHDVDYFKKTMLEAVQKRKSDRLAKWDDKAQVYVDFENRPLR